MKTFLLTIVLVCSMLLHAQMDSLPFVVVYPPVSYVLPYRNFQINADQTLNKMNKYTSFKTQLTDQTKNAWKDIDSIVCFYNPKMLTTLQIQYKYKNGVWEKSNKGVFNIDAKGNPLSSVMYNWEKDKNNWQYAGETDYTYNASHQLVQLLLKRRSYYTDSIIYLNRSEYTYNHNSMEILQIQQTWDSASRAWVNDTKITRTYDDHNNTLSLLVQNRDKKQNDWVNTELHTHTYDAAGNMLTDLSQKWENNEWSNEKCTVNFYNAANMQIRKETYQWIPETPECQALHEVDTYVYKTDGQYKKSIIKLHEWDIRNDSHNFIRQEILTYNKDSIIVGRVMSNVSDSSKLAFKEDSTGFNKYGNVTYFASTDRSGKTNHHTIRYLYYYLPYNIAAIDKKDNPLQVSLYYNPALSPEVYLQLNVNTNTYININILSSTNQKVYNETQQLKAGFNTIPIATKRFASGAYRIELTEPASRQKSILQWVYKKR